MSDVKQLLIQWRELIDKKLEELIESDYEGKAIEVGKYILMDGKRLRGSLAIMVATALGGTVRDALPAALALEMVHAASLSIDDIIDEDEVRRGKPSAWIAYGVRNTVMVSNLLIPHAILLIKTYGIKAITKVVEVWKLISKGEIWDVYGPPSRSDVWSDYLKVVEAKTASLFALSTYLGALAAGREDLIDVSWNYGMYLGIAYQMADDLGDMDKDVGFSGTVFKEIVKKFGLEGVRKKIWEFVDRAEELGRIMGKPLDEFPRLSIALLLEK
ncbi:geranylgeranyl pyrophosphate synthase [Ignicoccus islandicus DSM 13165]|uniref:Geranylgeranyl pyrophosphate synthase n=1 Tax=Ignicoccus islandicus DSM 13165 TaxID=940295 RepID=A0A0U3FPH9_9CREN|nr:polyprenyl synthetase family protein [Ignicoccus islandicus]ALU11831.1 geranylgeranyl pyrophosphate synthase [Ignicoccus islandicus DSM 13165]